ncbi:MAG: hypothetical protein DHS20C11_07710 [Lysobacteraceae bacterium]|nr:MAG: hypothetical protein DHS20C11_07710 [Xanthomonadaceae bacterium]
MNNKTLRNLTTGSLVLLAALFVALVMLSNSLLRGARLDLTENKLYSLSEGTRSMVQSIDEPINLYLFYSERGSRDIPSLRNYATRVEEFIDEIVQAADGNINFEVIEPLAFSEEEDLASSYGLQALPVGPAGESVYLGLAGTNTLDDVEVIPFFQPDKEPFLEYDLAKLIHTLANPQKPVVGLLSSLPMTRGFDPQTRQMREPWVAVSQLEQMFEVRTVAPGVAEIDDDIDLLIVAHPKSFSEQTVYAIDQFIMAGGNAIVLVDPHADMDIPPQDPNNPSAAMFASRSSDLPKLLQAWGLNFNAEEFVADYGYAIQVSPGAGRAPVRHLGILGLNGDAINDQDVITAELDTINVSATGYLSVTPVDGVNVETLLSSSDQAAPMATERLTFMQDPNALMDGFEPTGASYVLAARLTGALPSAFEGPIGEDSEAATHIAKAESANVIVIADTDILSDRLWVRQQNFFGQNLVSAWANNGDLAINAVDNLTGSSDLISIRGRATSQRPFTTVQALQRDAESRFRETEQRLQSELDETERNLTQLQQSRDDDNLLILSDEQRAELERFRQKKLDIRKELRQVQRSLDADIERLGTTLKVINIALVPALLIVGVLVVARLRRRQGGQ